MYLHLKDYFSIVPLVVVVVFIASEIDLSLLSGKP